MYDIGGSHIAAALCRKSDLRLGPVRSAPHSGIVDSAAFWELLSSLGRQVIGDSSVVSGAELAVPGPFDFRTGISYMRHKLAYLYGRDFRAELGTRLFIPGTCIGFVKDADAFLLGEIGAGCARGKSRVVGITLGTGIGSAFAVDGKVISSGEGVPPDSEIWNVPFQCGTVEDFVSARAIQSEYQHRTGACLEVSEIAAAAATDPDAKAAFVAFGKALGGALKACIHEFAPEVVVLGGGISHAAHLFLPAARSQFRNSSIQIQVSRRLEEAPLAGAGLAWFNEHDDQPVSKSSRLLSGEGCRAI